MGQLPVKSHKTKVTDRYLSYLYVHNDSTLLLHKRTADDIWKNLYELPLIETSSALDADALFATQTFAQWHAALPRYIYKGCTEGVKHVLSHRVLHASFHEFQVQGPLPCPEGFVIVPFDELHRYALPRLIERYLENENNVQDTMRI